MKKDHKLAIIADDFTGAGDSGVHFSRLGTQIKLLLHFPFASEERAEDDGLFDKLFDGNISINSETRFLSPNAASKTVRDVIATCRAKGYERFYKKIDSTMRGNPGAEIEAALAATGKMAALVCTAMPETGRSCIAGKIYLNGVPLHETDIGKDPFHPLSTSDISSMLAEQTSLVTTCLSLADVEAGQEALAQIIHEKITSGTRLLIADAINEQHLQGLAKVTLQCDCLPVGAGGFARALAKVLADESDAAETPYQQFPEGPLLAVVGSLAKPSLRQADAAAEKEEFKTIILPPDTERKQLQSLCQDSSAMREGQGRDILLRMDNRSVAQRVSKEEGARIAALLGDAAEFLCKELHCKTVYGTGGETAIAVASALGIHALDLVDELLPGVVLGACHSDHVDVKWFISKAGGFGNDAVLLDILAQTQAHNHQQ